MTGHVKEYTTVESNSHEHSASLALGCPEPKPEAHRQGQRPTEDSCVCSGKAWGGVSHSETWADLEETRVCAHMRVCVEERQEAPVWERVTPGPSGHGLRLSYTLCRRWRGWLGVLGRKGQGGGPRRTLGDGSGRRVYWGPEEEIIRRVTRTGMVPIQAECITHLTVNPRAYTSLRSAFGKLRHRRLKAGKVTK